MVVTRAMSGTTKKADTKVVVNHKVAERSCKKTTAKRANKKTPAKRARITFSAEDNVSNDARYLFIDNTFIPQFYEKHPDVIVTYAKNLRVGMAGAKVWYSMTDSDRAPYVAEAKKKMAENEMQYKAYLEGTCPSL